MENQHPSRSGTGQQPVRDWTKPERGDITDRGQARNYGSEAQEYVQGAVQQTREYVEDTVQQARDKMTEYRAGGVERVKQDMVLSFAKTASDSPGEDPWATGGLSTPDGQASGWPAAIPQGSRHASVIGPGTERCDCPRGTDDGRDDEW
jgi:hypothetical protein